MYNLKCVWCDSKFTHQQPNTKTCSELCRVDRNLDNSRRYSSKSLNLTTSTVGALSEMLVSADLLKKGYDVFRSLSPSCFCDLVAIKNQEKILKVEVRTGYRNKKTGHIYFPRKTRGDVDIFGVWEKIDDKVYYFDNKGKVELDI